MRVERELQNEKFLPTVGLELGTFRIKQSFTKQTRYHWATRTDVCQEDKNSPGSPAIFRNLPVTRGRL